MEWDTEALTDDAVVSDYLKELRARVGMSQMELATRIGESQSFVSKYENAQRRLTAAEFVRVVRALGMSIPEAASELDEKLP